jgi:hypothetical protein
MNAFRWLLTGDGSAGGEVEGHYPAHTVSDHHRLGELKPLAHPGQIVGEDLHRVALVRLVALAVPAQVGRYDTVALLCKMLELGREVCVVAAPPMD